MLRVDAHHHLWNTAEQPYPWLTEAPEGSLEAALPERYELEHYRRDVERWEVGASVHVQADYDPRDPVGETRWLQRLHERDGLPSAIVGYARLQSPDVEETLRAHLAHDAFRGVRQTLAWGEPPELMGDADWRRGFALLEPLGLSFDLSALPEQLADAAELARAFPETSIVLDHAGMPGAGDADRACWRDGLRRLAEQSNVTAKLSGITQPRRGVAAVRDDLEEVLAAFGAERAMFATNLPVEHLEGSVEVLVEALDGALAGCSTAEREAVWGATAARVYRLPAQAVSEAP